MNTVNTKKLGIKMTFVFLCLWFLLQAGIGFAQDFEASVFTHESRGEVMRVGEARAHLSSNYWGAALNLEAAELIPNHVYTVWWLIYNHPELCVSTPCSFTDLLDQTPGVNADAGYAAGFIADSTGKASLNTHLALGNLPHAWYGHGFTTPYAEIHILVKDHGQPIAGLENDMLSSYQGGCSESIPNNLPASVQHDGLPGSNKCQLFQTVVFR